MTKLAVNFGPGEAFEVFVERGQLGKAVAVLAGRWAEVLVDPLPLPAGLDGRIKEFHEKHEAFKRAMDQVGGPQPGRRYRLSGDGWVVTFTHFNLVEVNGKLNDDQLANEIDNLAGKNGGADAIRECVRIALHFLKSRFVMRPDGVVSEGAEASYIGLHIFPDRVECWDGCIEGRIEDFVNAPHAWGFYDALFHLVKICDLERDKNVTGTAVEAPPAIAGCTSDKAAASQQILIGVSGPGWRVTYLKNHGVEFNGDVDWNAFSKRVETFSRHVESELTLRGALVVAVNECRRRGLSTGGVSSLYDPSTIDGVKSELVAVTKILESARRTHPPAIVDGIDTSQGVAIKPAPRTAHIAVSGTGWIVTYWENGWVDICGTVDWLQFFKNLEKLASHADAAPSVRNALKVAWVECMKLGLVSLGSMPDRQMSVIGPGFRFYKGPDAIWMERMDQSIVDEGCNIMHITNIVEALFTSTRMLADAAKKAAEPKLRTAHLRVFHDDWSVTYLDDGKVEFQGEPCWGRFGNNLDVAMERKEITIEQVRKAILFALVECSKLGLINVGAAQPARTAIYYGAYMRVYRHPDHVWIREDAYDLLARESAKIQQDKVVEVLTVVTRMLGGAK